VNGYAEGKALTSGPFDTAAFSGMGEAHGIVVRVDEGECPEFGQRFRWKFCSLCSLRTFGGDSRGAIPYRV
jgi:hypothetical protein